MTNIKLKNDMDRRFAGFPITSVSRDDLERKGFDAHAVDDATMKKLALQLASDYCVQLFWDSLEIIAEYLEIPKRVANK